MATRPLPDAPATRLYLVTPPVADPANLPADLADALAAAQVAAILMHLAPAGERALSDCVKAIAPAVQQAGTALLLDGHVDLVGRTGADGAHLTGIAELAEALPRLKPERIAGTGRLMTRHDAMVAAETGTDYVMFGDPDRHGIRPAFEAILERIDWWSDVFEVPCVGYAASLDEVGPLAAAGADFVALGPRVFDDPRGLRAALEIAAAHIGIEAPK